MLNLFFFSQYLCFSLYICRLAWMSVLDTEVDGSNPNISMLFPWARHFIRIDSVDSAVKWVPGGDNLVKDVQCYELFGGIALKNHAFSFLILLLVISARCSACWNSSGIVFTFCKTTSVLCLSTLWVSASFSPSIIIYSSSFHISLTMRLTQIILYLGNTLERFFFPNSSNPCHALHEPHQVYLYASPRIN